MFKLGNAKETKKVEDSNIPIVELMKNGKQR